MTLPEKVARRFMFAMIPPRVQKVAKKVSAFLKASSIPHAVAGGMAVSFHGYPRMTDDVDLLIDESDWNAVEAQYGAGHPISGYLHGMTVKVDGVKVDFLFAAKDVTTDDIHSAQKVSGLPVVRIESLVVMKLGAGRAKDTADIIELVKNGAVPLDRAIQRLPEAMKEDFDSLIAIAEAEKAGDTKTARTLHIAMLKR